LASVDSDMEYLEIVLMELSGAVVVCDRHARVLLHSAAAKRVFAGVPEFAPGCSLYQVCARASLEQTLRLVSQYAAGKTGVAGSEAETALVCAAADGSRLLHCRISAISAPHARDPYFLCTFEDVTRWITQEEKQGQRLKTLLMSMRSSLGNLVAAAETLHDHPEMAPEARHSFEEVVFRESTEIQGRFASLAQEVGGMQGMRCPVADVSSADLIECLAQRLRNEAAARVTMTGVPLWLRADAHALLAVLDRLARFVLRERSGGAIEMEALLGDRRVYLDMVWSGDPLPQPLIDAVLEEPLPGAAAGVTCGDVLRWHDSEVWSQKHRRAGLSLLRLPLPDSPRQWEMSAPPAQTVRPLYGFLPLRQGPEGLGDRRLDSLSFVVFDTESTAWATGGGNEILALAAVRVGDGRILSGERFEQVIRPGSAIPEETLSLLALSGDALQQAPTPQEMMQPFRSFVGDAVLVGHNAVCDMEWLRHTAEAAGGHLDNPLLDTLLLALVMAEDRTDFTLEGIGRDIGVSVNSGHTPMEGCYATAQVLLRLLELLAERGIVTLGQAVAAADQAAGRKHAQPDRRFQEEQEGRDA